MLTRNQHLYTLIVVLAIVGSAIFFYRYQYLGVPLTPSATVNSWTVEANLKFQADSGTPVKATFFIPNMPPFFAILDEYFVSHNYGVTTNRIDDNRQTVWAIRRASGSQSLYYRAILRKTDSADGPLEPPSVLKKVEITDTQKAAVEALSNNVRKSSADIQTFAQETIKQLRNKDDGNVKVLTAGVDDSLSVVKAATMVLNQAKIHTKIVQGIKLKAQTRAEFATLLGVYDEKRWIFIDPVTQSAGLPENFLIWQYGDAPVYSLSGGTKGQFSIATSPTPVNALSVAKIRGTQTDSKLIKFSLLQLPVSVQETYKVLLTVPIGAFIILLLRNFIGLVTFGTFMPVLIALAFRETHIVWGVTLFTTIVAMGLIARFYLDQLKLLLVPRLAAILTVVILLMVMISIVSQHLGIDNGLSVALFPMVILTMTIERMCITWDERGPFEAIQSGVGSIIAAVIAYAFMQQNEIEYLFFAFPELLLVLVAIILWFGMYRGYRLSELIRFRYFRK